MSFAMLVCAPVAIQSFLQDAAAVAAVAASDAGPPEAASDAGPPDAAALDELVNKSAEYFWEREACLVEAVS